MSNTNGHPKLESKEQPVIDIPALNKNAEKARLSLLLASSIAHEENKNKRDESQAQYIARIENQLSCLKRFCHLWLLTFECTYNDREDYAYEILDEYEDCAKFMEQYFGRTNNVLISVHMKKQAMLTKV